MSHSTEHDELAALLCIIAGDAGSAMERIGRASRALKWEYGRTKRIWYREARRIDATELEQARLEARRSEERTAHAELNDVRARLARLEARGDRFERLLELEDKIKNLSSLVGAERGCG